MKLEVDKKWRVLFLTSNMKEYFGLTQEGRIVHTTMGGMKTDKPIYFNKVLEKLISKEFMSDGDDRRLDKIISYIK